ncbi:hypothetical protein M378DRAFT_380901 [Amanita muscaria Koide BX008]|uniref:Uncharacterized protein n=1 Tax=Amanita muscaria (strain Koide BX008) TaxID=946122 RepID=A0A0C2WLL1_AMAMK|nr:hypothetical protein M378DRAFT_380901 [Amanita muscaria Koide BX008]
MFSERCSLHVDTLAQWHLLNQFLCRKFASVCRTFHCRTLSLGRVITRNLYLLRSFEYIGVQCWVS